MKDTPTMGDNSKNPDTSSARTISTVSTRSRRRRRPSPRSRDDIIDRLEKEGGGGVNRGALAEIRRMLDLSPAAIAAREESRKELFDWLVTPKLAEAEAGEADE